jgi:Spy/CpxP family protein refolding chaperone
MLPLLPIEFACQLTEMALLGTLAWRTEKILEWGSKSMRVTIAALLGEPLGFRVVTIGYRNHQPANRNHRGRFGFNVIPPMNRHLMRFSAVAALAAGMLFAQAPSTAGQPGSGKTAVRPRAVVRQRIAKALNLTDAQKQQAQAIIQQTRQTVQPLRQQAKQNRQALMAAIQAGKGDVEIHQLALTQGNLAGQLVAARAEALAKFYGTLTPEQRAKADLMRQQLRQMIKQRIQQRLTQGGNG